MFFYGTISIYVLDLCIIKGNKVCLGEQDGRSSVEGQPQQMAVCLVKQDGRSFVTQ